MDKNEIKAKLFKGITIALPILLVAILAMLVVVAMNLADDNSIPVFGNGEGTTTTTTTTNQNGAVENPDDTGGDGGDESKDPVEPTPDPSSEGLSFVSNGDGTCSLNGIGDCDDSFIIVPMENEDGEIVVEVADNAFKNCSAIKGIELPETVERIGSYAFYGSAIREMSVGKNVREIGNYAFAGCKYLTGIAVDKANSNYSSSSGVLYSKDGSRLITYPAGKTDNFCVISRDVTEIANMAFYKCTYIKKVTYHGTSASWKAIEIGAGNDVIDEAIIYCAGDDGK